MGEVPHCPECNRLGPVSTRKGPGYEYYCRNCHKVFKPDEVTDKPWVDMVHKRMFNDYDAVLEQATQTTFSPECSCEWCTQ